MTFKTHYPDVKNSQGKHFSKFGALVNHLVSYYAEKTYEQHYEDTLKLNFSVDIIQNVLNEYANGFGAPKIAKKYGVTNDVIYNILQFSGVKLRTRKESANAGALHTRKSNIEKYGVPCTLQVKEFDDKRKQTFLTNYGVDNPFKIKNFHEKIESAYIEKYGHGLKTQRSIKSKEAWAAKTPEERNTWVSKSFHSRLPTEIRSSSLETRVKSILDDYEVSYSAQFRAGSGGGRGSYSYDIYIPSGNLIIEINGTYFHADPRVYKPDDLLLKSKNALAKELWEYDRVKQGYAVNKGYNYLVIWEIDLKSYSDKDVIEVIYDAIYSGENKIN